MEKESSVRQIVGGLLFFKDLTEADIDFLLAADAVRNYPKRSFICTQGDRADFFFVVLDGWVKLHNMNAEGEKSAVQLLTKGEAFGIDTIFDGGLYLYSAEAVSECRLLEISAQSLKERVMVSPNLAAKLLGLLSHKIKDMQIASACSFLGSSSRRLACLFLRLSSWMIGKGGTLRLPYEKSIASIQLGMDQATFSRALAKLEELGVTSRSGEITISDFSRLSDHCCTRCPIPYGQCAGRRAKTIKENKKAT